jgi:heat shock factor-binding protein 1
MSSNSSSTIASSISAESTGANADPQELTIFVQQLLQQMQSRFQTMSDTIISKIDEMGKRIDDLEQSLQDVMQQSGGTATGTQSSSTTQ